MRQMAEEQISGLKDLQNKLFTCTELQALM